MKHMWLMAAGLLALSPAVRADEPGVRVDLNKLQPADSACRVFLVLENHAGEPFSSLKLDLVIFGTDGVVADRLAVEGAPLPVAKTSLKAFDIQNLACNRIGRILLNDVRTCEGPEGPREDCLAVLATSSHAAVPFIK